MLLGWMALGFSAVAGILLFGHVRRMWPASSIGGAFTGWACLATGAASFGAAVEFASTHENDLHVLEWILAASFGGAVFFALAAVTAGPWYIKQMLRELQRDENAKATAQDPLPIDRPARQPVGATPSPGPANTAEKHSQPLH